MPQKKKILIILVSISVAISLVQLSIRTVIQSQQTSGGLHQLAEQFLPLQPIFKKMPRVGYYTDKNIEHPLAVAQFELAQFVLAPTVLELNNTNLPLIIFDCTTPQEALRLINELKLKPITASNTGLILAANPKAAQ